MERRSKRSVIAGFFKSLASTKQDESATVPKQPPRPKNQTQGTSGHSGYSNAHRTGAPSKPKLSTVSSAQTIGLEKEPILVDEHRLSEGECDEDSDDSALSLWDIACARLRREEPELMNAYANDLLTADSRQVSDEDPDGYYQERRLQELTLRKLDFLAEARWKITIRGKDFIVRDQIAKIARKVLSFKDSIGVAVSAEPHAALAWAGVLVILPLLSNPGTQWEDAADGLRYISDILIRSRVIEVNCGYGRQVDSLRKFSPSTPMGEMRQQIRARLIDLYCGILRYQILLASHCSRNRAFRLVRDIFATGKWNEMLDDLRKTESNIDNSLRTMDSKTLVNVDAEMSKLQIKADKILKEITKVDKRVEDLQRRQLLAALQYAEYAAFDAVRKDEPPPTRCYNGTRKEIIEELETWVYGSNDDCIFWLSGMAGTGKSTIARTVADLLDDEHHCLGASFFFSRGRGLRAEATAFITTIALQLAERLPVFAPYLASAVDAHNRVGELSLSNQWDRLIMAPLTALSDSLLLPVKFVFVIDALDECQGAGYVSEIVQLLSRAKELQMVDLRIFVTSRNESYIETSFKTLPGVSHRDLSIDYSLDGSTERDISSYMRASLKSVAELHLLEDWPGEKLIQGLIEKAGRLFVYASTACRYLQNSAYPEKRLLEMLDTGTKGHSSTKALDDMYLLILSQVLDDCTSEDRADVALLFQQVVGSIVTSFEPLSPSDLASLLCISLRQIGLTLKHLHSLLHVPEDQDSPVEVFHLSFRDFIANPSRCTTPQLRVDECHAHDTLFLRCVELMTKSLCRDMCDLAEQGVLTSTIPRSGVNACIPHPLRYSCLYFTSHISKAKISSSQSTMLYQFLQHHLLHWLEALSLMQRVADGVRMLQVLEDKIEAERDPSLHAFINDAKRFLLYNRVIIEEAPLQVYSSALVFAPQDSLVRRHFIKSIPDWIEEPPKVAPDWTALLQGVNDISISPDGSMIVSASGDRRVRLWDVKSGHPLFTLEGHQDWIDAVAFSPLGDTVASGSGDRSVRIWDVYTGRCLYVLHGHEHSATSVAFSPDGKLLASTSYDRTIRLWDTSTGSIVHILRGHDDQVRTARFSPDGRILASAGVDQSIRVWDVEKGCTLQILRGHRDRISSLAFAPQGTVLASGSEDNTIRLWDLDGGGTSRRIDCHLDWVHDVTISRDGTLIATASADKMVRVLDMMTAKVMLTLEGHSNWVTAVTFSWDSKKVVSASFDHTIRIWDVKTGELSTLLDNSRVPEVLLTAQGQPEDEDEVDVGGKPPTKLQPTERFVSRYEPLYLDGDWITYEGKRLLFLPAEYRPY
ncbi:hypothetical protein BJY04DRAFT_220322 [Aspergillus karnatakaensis]|uniref:uncharacterized protein n=1 Tax=Aspergillus karnatakaensis TaxID=1810916 RepID=UPI003CCE0F11